MRKLTALVICACVAISAAFAQTRQQALDEIARIEKFDAQIPEMLRQAWEAGRTQTDTVIDTPYGKVSIKFNLDERIRKQYTGYKLTSELSTWHGVILGNAISINKFSQQPRLGIRHEGRLRQGNGGLQPGDTA